MKVLAVYDAVTGELRQTMIGPETELLAFTPDPGCGSAIVPDDFDPRVSFINVGTLEPEQFPPRPSPDHVWDWPSLQWTVTLDGARARRLADLKALRDQKLDGGFAWSGYTFDSDALSQSRLLGAYVSALNTPGVFPVNWRLANNAWVSLTAGEMLGVWAALQTHIQTRFANFGLHEATINALPTVEAVQAHDISSGW